MMANEGYKSKWYLVCQIVFWALYCAFFTFPLLWALLVSLQPDGDKYKIFPDTYTFKAFNMESELFSSICYSAVISLIASIVTLIIALSSAYLIHARVVSLRCRKMIAMGAISLFFMPAFAIYPGVEFWSLPYVMNVNVLLIIIQIIQGFPITFVLLVALFASLPRDHFNQLVLETGSRVKAFEYGILRRSLVGILAVFTITFSTVWCEFYVTNDITTREGLKPFSVKLATLMEMYTTKYSGLAAGAVVSILISTAGLLVVMILQYTKAKRSEYARKRYRDS